MANQKGTQSGIGNVGRNGRKNGVYLIGLEVSPFIYKKVGKRNDKTRNYLKV